MVVELVAFLAVAQGAPAPVAVPQASKIVGDMLAKYAKAQTMVGKITLTQTAAGGSGQIVTEIQYERPTKLFIRQTKKIGDAKQWIVSATGKVISYDDPQDRTIELGGRLLENQVLEDRTLTVEDVYLAAARSLGDRSMPLDVSIGAKAHLLAARNQWATLANEGKVKVGEKLANKIAGKWREGQFAAVSGTFEMYITDEGDLVRYVLIQDLLVDRSVGAQRLVSTWDCDFQVNAKPDQAVFKVYR